MSHIAPFALPIFKSKHYRDEYVCEAQLMTMIDVAKMIYGEHYEPKELACILLIDPEMGTTKDVTNEVAYMVYDLYDIYEIKPDPDTAAWLYNHGKLENN
jgi:hypothetical protein